MTHGTQIDPISLRLLAAAADTGSIRKAAFANGFSQPSASTRLMRLEQATGLRLLTKTASGSSLTTDGYRFRVQADRVLRALDDLDATVFELREKGLSTLQVGASFTIAEYLIYHWLSASGYLQKEVQVELGVGNSFAVCEMVSRATAMIGFIETPWVPDDFDSMVVSRDELVVVVSPTHEWASVETIDAEQLGDTPLVMREKGSGTREYARMHLEKALGYAMSEPSLELGSTTALKSAVMRGAGAAILSCLTVRDDLSAGRLKQVSVKGVRFTRDLRAIYLRGTHPTGAAKELVQAARDMGG